MSGGGAKSRAAAKNKTTGEKSDGSKETERHG